MSCWLNNVNSPKEWWIKSITQIALIHDSGGYRELETPCPISNQEAKQLIADNTLSYWDGNVGRCQFRDSFYPPPISSYTKAVFLDN